MTYKIPHFSYEHAGLTHDQISAIIKKIFPEIDRVTVAQNDEYQSPYGFVHSINDSTLHKQVLDAVVRIQELRPTMLVLVGVGGSQLGTLAVQEALYGFFYNESNPSLKFYTADTVETERTHALVEIVEKELQAGGRVVLCVVSKTGKTVETGINAAFFWDVLQKYHPHDAHKYVVIISDQRSVLWDHGKELGATVLDVPKKIGGRYSVFSAVGLFPLKLLGVDIEAMCAGARDAFKACTTYSFENSAAVSAALLYAQWCDNIRIHDTFIFFPDGVALGNWYRQLVGESLGKNQKTAPHHAVGILPTVSLGTTDLHSVIQHYLGAPHERFTTFMIASDQPRALHIPQNFFSAEVGITHDISTHRLMHDFMESVQRAYSNQGRPFATLDLKEISPYTLGYFMMFKMLEIVYLGYLLDVNVFDQPHVELYKKEMRELLLK